MPCFLPLAASLALADSYALPRKPPTEVSPLVSEPLYADIISRARTLEAEVGALEALPGLKASPGVVAVKRVRALAAPAETLSRLDMKGHLDLEARHRDGDLKCILKGVSQDLPRKLAAVEAARTGAEEYAALDELHYLLDDNVGVITAPPEPPS